MAYSCQHLLNEQMDILILGRSYGYKRTSLRLIRSFLQLLQTQLNHASIFNAHSPPIDLFGSNEMSENLLGSPLPPTHP